jgi:RHS repeat-associated protein
VKEATGTYYYLAGLGTPGTVGLIDSTGSLKDRYRYAPWGSLEDSLETVPNVLKFASREYDAETHLYYDRARYYDPQLSRFISEDPIGLAGGINQYAYASDDPINFSDPSGLEPCPFIYKPYCGWTLSGVNVWAASQEDQFMEFSVGGFDGPAADPSGPKRPQPADARRLMDGEPGPGSPPPAKKPSHALSCGAAVANAAINLGEDALLLTGIGAVAEAADDISTGLIDNVVLEDFSIQYEPPPPGDYNTMRSVAITIGGTAYKNGANLGGCPECS